MSPKCVDTLQFETMTQQPCRLHGWAIRRSSSGKIKCRRIDRRPSKWLRGWSRLCGMGLLAIRRIYYILHVFMFVTPLFFGLAQPNPYSEPSLFFVNKFSTFTFVHAPTVKVTSPPQDLHICSCAHCKSHLPPQGLHICSCAHCKSHLPPPRPSHLFMRV